MKIGLLFLFYLIILNSCSRYVPLVIQSPSLPNSGVVNKKGDLIAKANYYKNSNREREQESKINGFDIQGKYAFRDKIFIEGTYAYGKEFGKNTSATNPGREFNGISKRNYKINHQSLGVGYIGKLNDEINVMLSLGWGKSNYNTNLITSTTSDIGIINFKNDKIYSNFIISKKTHNTISSFGTQFSFLSYNQINGNNVSTISVDIIDLKNLANSRPILIQPYMNFAFSPEIKNLYINLHLGYNFQTYVPDDLRIRKITLGIGMSWALSNN